MNIKLYARLAAINLKKNHKTYIPYLLTCIGTIAMFYMMGAIASNQGLSQMRGADVLKTILGFGTIVIGIFSVIFLFYTNSFLMKRRKKEIGLYNILGMEKKHIAKMLFFEVLYTAIGGLTGGLLLGILASKLMYWLLLKLMDFPVPLTFSISSFALGTALLLFLGIFALSLLADFGKITVSNPIELLQGGNVGEKEPKTKWLLTLLGAATLGSGYYIALATESPLEAIGWFFLAVVLVIIGTYCLFTSGSIAVLKLLRKNKRFYYKTRHFTAVSGMLYRMKQNAVGLANICILSTMVLVMLSSTVSLYIGEDDVLKNRYPKECNISMEWNPVAEQRMEESIHTLLEQKGLKAIDVVNYHYIQLSVWKDNSGNLLRSLDGLGEESLCYLTIIEMDDYARICEESVGLEDNEAILLASYQTQPVDFTLGSTTWHIKQRHQYDEFLDKYMMADAMIFAVNDLNAVLEAFKQMEGDSGWYSEVKYKYGFDMEGDKDTIRIFEEELRDELGKVMQETEVSWGLESREANREEFLTMHGGLFFLGIFLGTLFLMATVLIIYYKQISEGFDDKERFQIMQKVGMGKTEVKKTIQSQIRMVFFLPLLVAIIHIAFAFPVITKLLYVMNLNNVPLFFACTVGAIVVFAIIYIGVFLVTAREYYRIVR